MWEPPILINKSRFVRLWPRDNYMMLNFLSIFGEYHLGAFKSLPWKSFLYSHFSVKVKRLHFNLPKFGIRTPLEYSLNVIKLSHVRQNYQLEHEFLSHYKYNSIFLRCFKITTLVCLVDVGHNSSIEVKLIS